MTETSAPGGSRLRGILGTFLCALPAALCADLLIFYAPDSLGKLTVLTNLILVSCAAVQGYRLFRGFRSMKFARWTVRLTAALVQPLALALALTLSVLHQAWGTLPLSAEAVLITFSRSLSYLTERDVWPLWVMFLLGTLLFCRLSWPSLLKYVDPAWYNDPRRLALVGGNGATYNTPPCWPLPPASSFPTQFTVDKGKLTVEGTTFTYKPWAKPPRTFRLTDIAGVVLGASTAHNILYDKDNQFLARFAWSRENALLLGQYLIAHNVPFIDPSGAPVPPRENPSVPEPPLPDTFTLREPRATALAGWLTLLFFIALAALSLWVLDFPTSLLCGGFFLSFTLLSLYLLLSRKNHRLTVEGTTLTHTTFLGKTALFQLSDIARAVFSLNGLKLLDREGRPLARLSLGMEHISLLHRYLQQHRVPLDPFKPRKD